MASFRCDSQNQVLYDAGVDAYVAYLRGASPEPGRRRTVVRLTSPALTQLPFDFREDTTFAQKPGGVIRPAAAAVRPGGDDG